MMDTPASALRPSRHLTRQKRGQEASNPEQSGTPGRGRGAYWLFGAMLPVVVGSVWGLATAPWLAGHHTGTFCTGVLLGLLIVCCVTDLSHRKIYNWLTYPAFLWAVLVNTLPWPESWPMGAVGLGNSLAGAVLAFVCILVVYSLSGGGAGDVKLATALGAWLGPQDILYALVATYAVGGVLLLGLLFWQVGPLRVLVALLRRIGSTLLPGWIAAPAAEDNLYLQGGVPMSPFFLAGVLLTYYREMLI